MHIPDSVLSGPVIGVTTSLAAVGVAVGLRKMDYERAPRVGMLASVFFVASLIAVPVGPTSVHLLLAGLMGFLLGWAALPALAVALLMQAIIFGFGGVTSLGANVLNMGVPAVACYYLFARRVRSGMSPGSVFTVAFVAGVVSVILACVMTSVTLLATGKGFLGIVGALFAGHVPVMVIEGFITGWAVVFLYKVHPDLLDSPLVGPKGRDND